MPVSRNSASATAFRSNLADARHGTINGYMNFGCRCAPCKEANSAYQKAYRAAHPGLESGRYRRRAERAAAARYGISVAELRALIAAAHSKCQSCARPLSMPGTGASPVDVIHVDHDHVTGKVRGILCSRCNLALGLLEACRADGFTPDPLAYLSRVG